MSKSFTAAAVLRLVATGRLALDDEAGSLVPGLSGPAASATVAQLLTHTSGLQGGAGEDHQPLSRAAGRQGSERDATGLPCRFRLRVHQRRLHAARADHRCRDRRLPVSLVPGLPTPYFRTVLDSGDGDPAAEGPRAVGYTDEGRSPVMGAFAGPHWALSGNGDLAMTVPELASWTAALFGGELLPARWPLPRSTKPRWDNADGTSETFGWVRFDQDLFGATGLRIGRWRGRHRPQCGGGPSPYLRHHDRDRLEHRRGNRRAADAVHPSCHHWQPEPRFPCPPARRCQRSGRRDHQPQSPAPTCSMAATRSRSPRTMELSWVSALGRQGRARALFGLPRGSDGARRRGAPASCVVELLTGDDPIGHGERQLPSARRSAASTDVRLQGTVKDDGELRTYVTIARRRWPRSTAGMRSRSPRRRRRRPGARRPACTPLRGPAW